MESTKKTPIPANENQRLQALDYYEIMDSESEERFDRLTLLASEICEVPISLVSLLDGERQWFKSRVGLDATETPREISFCQHAIMDVNTLEIENALEDARFVDNVLVTGDPNIRFYAGHPLLDENGFALGTLCVIDVVPRKLTELQQKALKILAMEVVSLIESRKKQRLLLEYKKFFDMSLDFLCVAGTDGYFKKMNPTFVKELGYTEQELLAEPFSTFIHKDDQEATIIEVHKLSKGYETIGFENRYRKKDGTYLWLHWNASADPFTGELFCAAHNITALKDSQEEISLLQEKNNSELNAINKAVVRLELTPDRKILNLNENFTDLFGYTDEILGQGHDLLLFDEDKNSEEYELFWEELLQNKVQNMEFRRKTKDGRTIWIKGSYIPVVNSKKKVKRIIKLAYDITQKKELSEDLQFLNKFQKGILDGTPQAIISTNKDGLIKTFNRGAENMLGYNANDIIDKENPGIFHLPEEVVERAKELSAELNEDIEPGFEAFIAKTRKFNTPDEKNWTYVRKDGTELPVWLSINCISDDQDEIIGYIGISFDLSEQRRHVLEIEKKNEELDQFAYIVSHDLKAPLRAISTLSTFLEEDLEGKLNEETEGNFALMRSRVARMESLINGILEYSKVGRKSSKNELIDTQKLVTDIIDSLEIDPKFKIIIQDQLPKVEFTEIQLGQVFQNLISNAIKYHDKDTGQININYHDQDGFHEFEVVDDGPGIEPQYQDKIFEIFQTLQSRDEIESTGIGLSIVKKIVEDHSGSIQVNSKIGEGSTFSFTIPK